MAYRAKGRRTNSRSYGRRTSGRRTARSTSRRNINRASSSRQRVELIIRSGPAVNETSRPFIPGMPGLAQVDTTNKRSRF